MKRLLGTLALTAAACLIIACGNETEVEPGSAPIEQRAADEKLSAEEKSDLMAGYHYCKTEGRNNLIERLDLNPRADAIDIGTRVARMPRWAGLDVGYVSVGCTEALGEKSGEPTS